MGAVAEKGRGGKKRAGGLAERARQGGFTLIELLIVISLVGAMSVLEMKRRAYDAEELAAKTAGTQMSRMAEAVNGYLVQNYPALTTATDPGCAATAVPNVCILDPAALIAAGMLPVGYNPVNAWGSEYSIAVKVVGTAPAQNLHGIILTKTPWTRDVNGSGGPMWNGLGRAVREIGPDGGIATTAATLVGHGDGWTAGAGDQPDLAAAGQLAARVGYNSSMMSVFLRRDGTLPMTGGLDMGGNDVRPARDMTASRNLYGAGMALTGNASIAGNAGVGTLAAGGSVTARSAAILNGISGGSLAVSGSGTVGGNLSVAGTAQGAQVVSTGNVTAAGAVNAATGNFTGDVSANDVLYTSIGHMATHLAAKQVMQAQWQGGDGDAIPKPVCQGGGTPSIMVSSSNVVSAGYWTWVNGQPYAATQVVSKAIDAGAAWQLDVKTWTVDGTGNWTGMSAGSATAQTYCKYTF